MITSKTLRIMVTGVTVFGLICPLQTMGDERIPDSPVVQPATPVAHTPLDIALDPVGKLNGMAVDENGNAMVDAEVLLLSDGSVIGAARSNASGQFQLDVQQGGVFQVAVDGAPRLVRCWAPETAPPSARETLLVSVGPLERGQISPSACGFANPWVITGLVVAAIVIPVAIHNNRDDRPNSSN